MDHLQEDRPLPVWEMPVIEVPVRRRWDCCGRKLPANGSRWLDEHHALALLQTGKSSSESKPPPLRPTVTLFSRRIEFDGLRESMRGFPARNRSCGPPAALRPLPLDDESVPDLPSVCGNDNSHRDRGGIASAAFTGPSLLTRQQIYCSENRSPTNLMMIDVLPNKSTSHEGPTACPHLDIWVPELLFVDNCL